MDISFDQFGGGGWGDHGEQELAASQVQKSLFDKIPIPASLDALISMNGDVEKYPLGSYSFNTIRIMGKIVNVASDTNQCTTYELCDALASDTRIAKRFTVIQYNPAEMKYKKEEVFATDQMVQIVGKLRLFNSRLSLICFHIREVNMDEINIYKLECKLARIYFEKNIPEHSLGPAEANTIFHSGNTSIAANRSVPTTGGNMGPPMRRISGGSTQGGSNRPQQQKTNPQQQGNQNWNIPQRQILEFIRRHAAGESGVHRNQIKNALKLDKCDDILAFLHNEGAIFATIDYPIVSLIGYGYTPRLTPLAIQFNEWMMTIFALPDLFSAWALRGGINSLIMTIFHASVDSILATVDVKSYLHKGYQ